MKKKIAGKLFNLEVFIMSGDIKQFEMMARREDWNLGVSIYARQFTEGQGCAFAQPLEMKTQNAGLMPQPFITLEIQAAQNLMDELWQCGLRPTEGSGSAGSLKATESHLDDMRKIAFKKLSIDR